MVTGLDLPSISTVSILAVVMGIVRWALHFFILQSKMDGFEMASQNVILRGPFFANVQCDRLPYCARLPRCIFHVL